ncbi:uncharacterized protein LOC114330367 isoform X1 [Diabrotica virgifera virgifera]|uniref:Ig-like domain-containing protein n=2 Tax=Diabrotica virgifera virgifera TaxID=50390 RepID=A0ABM5K2T6_DIAVI|nr:uncharacterized protein LOC114330367 isoform X1 [Diabrotica virgifera virgifera]
MFTRKSFIVLFLVCVGLDIAFCVQINYVNVPVAVKNDSNVSVIMDCNYSLRPDDTELVVKWYLNDDLVYQWIPPQLPQSFGKLKDRVDLEYAATDDPKSVYRAMKIFNPTDEIAGEYKCFVSTFTDEDFFIKTMRVFVPEKYLDVFKSGCDDDVVNFTCLASEVYPKPSLQLFKSFSDKYTRKNLPVLHWDVDRHTSGRFSTYITATVNRKSLIIGSLIHCELRIPDTGYVKIGSLLYYPEVDSKDMGLRPDLPTSAVHGLCLLLWKIL